MRAENSSVRFEQELRKLLLNNKQIGVDKDARRQDKVFETHLRTVEFFHWFILDCTEETDTTHLARQIVGS